MGNRGGSEGGGGGGKVFGVRALLVSVPSRQSPLGLGRKDDCGGGLVNNVGNQIPWYLDYLHTLTVTG